MNEIEVETYNVLKYIHNNGNDIPLDKLRSSLGQEVNARLNELDVLGMIVDSRIDDPENKTNRIIAAHITDKGICTLRDYENNTRLSKREKRATSIRS